MKKEEPTVAEKLDVDGKRHLKIGAGLGVISVGAVAMFGAIACPMCCVAVPAFLISGVSKRAKARELRETESVPLA